MLQAWRHTCATAGKHKVSAEIIIGTGYLDRFKETPNLTYVWVLHDILHEFIHVKEVTKMDYLSHTSELDTYIKSFELRGSLPEQNAAEKNSHWNNLIRNYFLPGENIKKPNISIEQSKAMINAHKSFLESYLKTLPKNTIANYKDEFKRRLGIVFNIK